MAKKKAELKYEKYFLKDVVHDAMNKDWGGEAISAGRGHDDIIPPNAKRSPNQTALEFGSSLSIHLLNVATKIGKDTNNTAVKAELIYCSAK